MKRSISLMLSMLLLLSLTSCAGGAEVPKNKAVSCVIVRRGTDGAEVSQVSLAGNDAGRVRDLMLEGEYTVPETRSEIEYACFELIFSDSEKEYAKRYFVYADDLVFAGESLGAAELQGSCASIYEEVDRAYDIAYGAVLSRCRGDYVAYENSGEVILEGSISGAAVKDIIINIEDGERFETAPHTESDMYIDILCYDAEEDSETRYVMYADGCTYRSRGGAEPVCIGRVDNVAMKKLYNSVLPDTSPDDVLVKYNYESVYITVNNDKNYTEKDFPEVEAASLKRFSYSETPRLWVLRFRCDSKEELTRVMTALRLREDVEEVRSVIVSIN